MDLETLKEYIFGHGSGLDLDAKALEGLREMFADELNLVQQGRELTEEEKARMR